MTDYTNNKFYLNSYKLNKDINNSKDNVHPIKYIDDQINIINKDKTLDRNKLDNYEPLDPKADRYDPYYGYLKSNNLDNNTNTSKSIFYLNVDSRYRRKHPTLIMEDSIRLQKNPIFTKKGSMYAFIYHPNHNFEEGNLLSLQNVVSPEIILRTITSNGDRGINFIENSKYGYITYANHNIPSSYNGSNITIKISGIKGDKNSNTINNIPVNNINTIHKVYVKKPNEIKSPAIDYDDNILYFKLPYEFIGTYEPYKYNFTVTISAIAGISIGYYNSKFPLDIYNFQGYFSIHSISHDGYTIGLISAPSISYNFIDSTSIGVGGENVLVTKIKEIKPGYSNPNSYKIELGTTYDNIESIKIVSSEFPNSKKLFRNYPMEAKNNVLYWQNLNDGNTLYNLEVSPGNYSPQELIDEIQNKFYQVKRIQSNAPANTKYTDRQYLDLSININTNQVKFKSYIEAILTKPIIAVIPDIDADNNNFTGDEEFIITIMHINHMLTNGTKILIKNAIMHMGIPETVINREHEIYNIVDADSYQIKLPKFNFSTNVKVNTKGGVSFYVYVPNIFRLRFDYTDTIGKPLGFRDVGTVNSITSFSSEITNNDLYATENLYNNNPVVGNKIHLSGDDYILMVIKQLYKDTMHTNGPVSNVYTKILLTDSPGKILFNTYVPVNGKFSEPINNIDELDFEFYSPDGTLYDFSGLDHSFTLEITTIIEKPLGTGISSKTGRVITDHTNVHVLNNLVLNN